MRKTKIVSLILAIAMTISALPVFAANEEKAQAEDDSLELMSLLPLEEIRADLILEGYVPSELDSIPVEKVLSNLYYADGEKEGEKIAVDSSATTVWSVFPNETGKYPKYDAWEKAGMNENINMSGFAYGYDDDYFAYYDYEFQMIVGSGKQLDAANKRYLVTLQMPREEKIFNFDVAAINKDGTVRDIDSYNSESYLTKNDVYYPVTRVCVAPYFGEDVSFGVSAVVFDEFKKLYSDVEIAVYNGLFETAEDIRKAVAKNENIDITDKLIKKSLEDSVEGVCVKVNSSNMLTVAILRDGEITGIQHEAVLVRPYSSDAFDTYGYNYIYDYALYTQNSDGTRNAENVCCEREYAENNDTYEAYYRLGVDPVYTDIAEFYLGLSVNKDQETNASYSNYLNKVWDGVDMSAVESEVYIGEYDSVKAIEKAVSKKPELNITESVWNTDMTAADAGLKIKYGEMNTFTVVSKVNGEYVGLKYIKFMPKTSYYDTEELYSEMFEYEIYTQDEAGVRADSDVVKYYSDTEEDEKFETKNNIQGTYRLSVTSDNAISEEYYLGMKLNEDYENITMSVYDGCFSTLSDIEKAVKKNAETDITAAVTAEDMTAADAGYKTVLDRTKKYITVVFNKGNVPVGIKTFGINVNPRTNSVYIGGIYTQDEDGCKEIAYSLRKYPERNDGVRAYTYVLVPGYKTNAEYYLDAEFYNADTGYKDSSKVVKAVVGHFNTLDEAAAAEDIKDKLFPADFDEKDAGYKADFSKGVDLTVFDKNRVWKYTIAVIEGVEEEETEPTPTPTPIPEANKIPPMVGSSDTDFSVEAAMNGDTKLDAYILPYDHDSYYPYNYQTLLINDVNADMSAIVPVAELGEGITIYNPETGEAIAKADEYGSTEYLPANDFTDGTVFYSVASENHYNGKEYRISMVKKAEGPKLFVNGPTERTVYFNNYTGTSHDIFIANIGTETLEGLKVTFKGKNIKLDDYWVVGGENNDTLAPFTTTDTSGTEYGELMNVAKIRLLPDTDLSGSIKEMSGKLTISADGQKPVVIDITGKAGNPKIVTTSVAKAVKYVPYSAKLTTDNYIPWNKVKFYEASYTETEKEKGYGLPEGLYLYPSGEVYGVPQETGTYKFKAKADHTAFNSTVKEFKLTVSENTDGNVEAQIDKDYEINIRVPELIKEVEGDQVFEIAGELEEFKDFWIDGEKLVKDRDYVAEEGSTKITIRAQTLKDSGNGTHTIAAEFRNVNDEMKKSAQNYSLGERTIKKASTNKGGGGSGGGGGSSSGSLSVSYDVTLNSVGGSIDGKETKQIKVKKGDKIADIPTPVKEGFKFGGWFKDAYFTQPYDVNEAVGNAFSLYAKWIPIFTVTFNANSGRIGNEETVIVSVAEGEKAVAPTPAKEGYIFAGWYTDAECTQAYDTEQAVAGSIGVFAKWNIEKAPETAEGFVDINTNDWFYNDVDWAYSNKFMVGVRKTAFAPNDSVTGGMVVAVLARLADVDVSKYENESFEDVYEGEWYTAYAKWAKKEGIVENVAFNPPAEITREWMGIVLMKYLDYMGAEYDVNDDVIMFADEALISEEAKESLQKLYKLGIFKGRGDNVIDPESFTTRAEFAALTHRISDFLNDK